MTIRSSQFFTFNGVQSQYFNISNVNMNSGMQSEAFASSRGIREQKVRGRNRPYFQEIQLEPYEFTVSFAFNDVWDDKLIRDVAVWLLSPRYYSPMVFAEDPDRIFYCLCIDSPELVHNCLTQGYINLKFRCIDAYSYTSVYTKIVDLTTNPSAGTLYTFENFGDAECKPLIEIYKIGAGNVNFYNQSNGNAEMSMTGLANLETVKIDCEQRTITSDIPLTYRYGNLVGDYLTIPIYNNYILIKGTCTVKFTYQLKRIQ